MIKTIIKRDGRMDKFDLEKIKNAISQAAISSNINDDELIEKITNEVYQEISKTFISSTPSVEQVQDIIEKVLIKNSESLIAKNFILYRAERTRVRETKSRLMKTLYDISFKSSSENDLKRENANIDGDTAMGTMLKYGSESAKEFYLSFVIDPKFSKAHQDGDIHIHDLDFYSLTMTCCQIDLIKLFEGGFSTGNGFLREPNDIRTYSSLACIAIQANQNDQHGGQSIPNFDYAMALGVKKTYRKLFINNLFKFSSFLNNGITKDILTEAIVHLEENLHEKLCLSNVEKYRPQLKEILKVHNIKEENIDKIIFQTEEDSFNETKDATYQAMEALIHNLNTMHSRAGAQVPFSSINYGTDTSKEGRLVISSILKATQKGLGNGETPIFPIQIFKVKEKVNLNPDDPNYDLFKEAIFTSSKRLFPNFSFLDASFNKVYYQEGNYNTEAAYMGCRTRVLANEHDKSKEIVGGRGNLSFTSINLPRIALQTRSVTKFFEELEEKISLVIEQLLERFEIQASKKVYNFPFLMGQNVWLDSNYLSDEEEIREVIKHGTLTIGFIGLAEALKVLTGFHHGQSDASQKLGLEIISFMRQKCDEASHKYKLNFSLIATPAEGLSGRFVKLDRKIFGVIPGVTEFDFYTNSFHVPVYYPISAFKKIALEAPYHNLTNGGHITYVELDGDISKNLEAFEKIIRFMHQNNIGYGSINHPLDRDPVCGYNGIIDDVCPKCGRKEDGIKFERIRRITGYLVGTLDRFNNAKKEEVKMRLTHLKDSNES